MVMSKSEMPVDLDTVMADPAAFFAQPQDVVGDPRFSHESKMKILRQWERDAHNLGVAENEGMGGGEESMHGRVLAAIKGLEDGIAGDQMQSKGQSGRSATLAASGYGGLEKTLRTAVCQILRGTREQPLAALLIAGWIGYIFGRLRDRL
jgi:hypothetical protein